MLILRKDNGGVVFSDMMAMPGLMKIRQWVQKFLGEQSH
jgi:hypothetical protein